jgi:hypothetical protein
MGEASWKIHQGHDRLMLSTRVSTPIWGLCLPALSDSCTGKGRAPRTAGQRAGGVR